MLVHLRLVWEGVDGDVSWLMSSSHCELVVIVDYFVVNI